MSVGSGKTVLRSLFAGQQWRHEPENRLVDTVRMERVGRIGRAALESMYYQMQNRL